MVCSVLLLATTVWSVHRLATPQQADNVIVAQQDSPTIPQTPSQEPSLQSIPTTSHSSTKQPVYTASTTPPLPEPTQDKDDTLCKTTEPLQLAVTPQPDDIDTLYTNTQSPVETILPVIQPIDNESILLADNPVVQHPYNEGKRFHFTASVGASALPKIGNDNATDEIFPMSSNTFNNSNEENFIRISPNTTLAANVGVNYSIPLGNRQGLEVGIGLSGYSYQAEATTYHIGTADGIDGNSIISINTVGEPESYNTLSLYASMPLIFNFRPEGTDYGWNMSITPSHSIATSRPIGILTGNRPVLNPWRLTMGLGFAFPRGFIRRLSLTANLLSLYTSSSLHEIGIEIGF